MARDLGHAFSLQQIGAAHSSRPKREADSTGRAALRFAGRAAAFISVTVFAVALTATAMYLMQL